MWIFFSAYGLPSESPNNELVAYGFVLFDKEEQQQHGVDVGQVHLHFIMLMELKTFTSSKVVL